MGIIGVIIFCFVAALIWGIYLSLDNGGLTLTAMLEEAKKTEQRKAREEKAREEKARKDSAYNDWHKRLISCYKNIENHIVYGENYNPRNQYADIWSLAENHPDDSRCDQAFRTAYQNHITWLTNIFNKHIHSPGYLAIPTCISVIQCLREASNDTSFDYAINILENLCKNAGRVEIYLKFTQYGDCLLNVKGLGNPLSLDKSISMTEQKQQSIEASITSEMGDHYENIASDLPNFVDYSAKLIWCIAAKKPFDQDFFDKAAKMFDRYTARCFINKNPTRYIITPDENSGYVEVCHVEHLLAFVYAKNQIGGKNTANQEKKRILEWVDRAISFGMTEQCYMLPSALAWMGLYELERDVLRHLVARKVNLPEEWQDRLGFLESGGTSNIKIYDADSDNEFLYDSSSLDWNADAFDLFFRKLEMTHKTMEYSLAISRWTKTLPLAHGQKVTQEQIEESFKRLIDDFDGEVVVRKEKAQALNLANIEFENSFIFRFRTERNKRNRCVSILFSSEKFGRNLNLTIIVLFTPEDGLSSEELRKYALAIKDNIYVESFQESILQAVDEVIKPRQAIYDNGTNEGEGTTPGQTSYNSEFSDDGEVFE